MSSIVRPAAVRRRDQSRMWDRLRRTDSRSQRGCSSSASASARRASSPPWSATATRENHKSQYITVSGSSLPHAGTTRAASVPSGAGLAGGLGFLAFFLGAGEAEGTGGRLRMASRSNSNGRSRPSHELTSTGAAGGGGAGRAGRVVLPKRLAWRSRSHWRTGAFQGWSLEGMFLIRLRGLRPSSFAMLTSAADRPHRRFASCHFSSDLPGRLAMMGRDHRQLGGVSQMAQTGRGDMLAW